MKFSELQKAVAVLQLSDRATMREIKTRYKGLVKRYHPDGPTGDEVKIREITEAYRVIMAYCGNYHFSFTREEFFEQNPEARLRDQFSQYWGPET